MKGCISGSKWIATFTSRCLFFYGLVIPSSSPNMALFLLVEMEPRCLAAVEMYCDVWRVRNSKNKQTLLPSSREASSMKMSGIP